MRPADPDDILRRLGARIAEVRVSRGMTQEELAESAQVSARWIQIVESGRQNLTIRTLVQVSNLLGVSLGELLARPVGLDRKRSKRSRRG